MKSFDVLIIGAGPGGYVAAEEAAQLGNSVAVIERNAVGGCCLNVGCIPSKAYLQYSRWLSAVQALNKNGISVAVNQIDFPSVVRRKNKIISTLQSGIHMTFKRNGIHYITGEAKHVEGKIFEVNGERYYGKHVLLATGGAPFIPDIPGLSDIDYLTTNTFFDMETLPNRLAIIGGGVIGVELAYAMKSFGTDVTIIEAAPDILLTVDPDARSIVKEKLQSMGIKIIVEASVQKVKKGSVLLSDEEIPFDRLLVATGRKQNLEIPMAMGLELDERKQFVKVNEYYETSMKNVYAVGDLIGGHTLAHAASAEGVKAVRAINGKKERPVSPYSIPRPLFIDPEVSEFGMSEEEARKKGYDVIVEKMPFSFNGRAICANETEGFVKIISETRYREILGAVIVGPNAADLIHQILAVREAEGTVDELANTVFAHPTVSELIQETAKRIMKHQ
ncbi:dihydrolipoyl dehydrogenase [Ureibacillus terrenus]|uniref:dihydrolipoyl dehydrogenase n=1 Tax=Ureibacillus terrenus TaxID=118246 RepID=UPI002E1E1ADC|nr:dihydrolipoyl dehydrogenase [Ureibacillus terrenus]